MVQHNGQACTHDRSGNLTAYILDSRKRAFEYDSLNLLHSARVDDTVIEYEYDGEGYPTPASSYTGTASSTLEPDAQVRTSRVQPAIIFR